MNYSYLSELADLQRFKEESDEVERRAATVREEEALRLTNAYLQNPYLNREIMASLALAGMSEDQIRGVGAYATSKMVNAGVTPSPNPLNEEPPSSIARQALNNVRITLGYGGPGASAMTPIGTDPTVFGQAVTGTMETLGDIAEQVSTGYQEIFDAVVPEAVSSRATRYARGAIRTGVTVGESTGQFAQNRISQAIQFAESKGYEWWDLRYTLDFLSHAAMLNEESRREMLGAAQATDLGVAIQEYRDVGRVDLGAGFFPAGTVDSRQAEAQRELLGTLPGPNGQEYAWTPGRFIANESVDAGLFSHDNMAFNITSGLIDGGIKAVADVTNLIGGTRIGTTAIRGAKMPRNAARYNQLASEARAMMEAGNTRMGVLKMREAQEAIGIRSTGLSDDAVRAAFDAQNEVDVFARAQLLDEAGIYVDGNTVRVSLPETAKFFSSGNGRRLVDLMIERNTPAQIIDLFQDNISPTLAKRIAETSDRTEIIRVLGEAYANPGGMLGDSVSMFPHVGVFNIRDKGATVRRAVGAHMRTGKYLPTGSILNPQDPTKFIHDFKLVANSLPLGAAKDGYSRFDPRIVDKYVNKFVNAFAAGDRGRIVEVVGEFESDLVRMFDRLGFTMEEAESLTKWSANADRIGQYLMKDLAANNPLSVAESGIATYQDMLQSGIMVIDNDRLQQVIRRTGRVKQILRNNPATSQYAALKSRVDNLSDKIDDLIQKGKTAEAAELVERREGLRTRLAKMVDDSASGKNPKDLVWMLQSTVDVFDAARYYWKSSTIMRLAYLTRVLPDEIARVLVSGSFDDPIDWFAAVATGGYKFDAAGQEFIGSTRKYQELQNTLSELVEARDFAEKAGDMALASSYATRISDQLLEIEQLEEAWDASRRGFHEALISTDSRRASETVMRERTRRANASGVSKQVNRNSRSETERREWAEALIQQVGRRSADPVMSEIARAMTGRQLKLNAPFEIDGVRGNLAEHLAAGRVANAEEGIAYWLFDGPGNEFWQTFVFNKMRTGTSYDVNSFDSVMAWVNQLSDEIGYLTGGRAVADGVIPPSGLGRSRLQGFDSDLLDVIATGRFRDRPISSSNRSGAIQTNQEAVYYVDQDFRRAENAPDNLIYRSRGTFGDSPDTKYQMFVNWFFGSLYGVPSDKLARSPLFRRIYWNTMTDLVRSASPEEAARIVRNAEKAKLSPALMDRLVTNSRANLADASVKELDELARGRALAEVKDLLFDATKRGAGADALRFVVAFGDAWKEVMQTYGRLLVNRRGKPALRIAQGVYAGTKSTVGGPGDIYGINPLTGEPTVMPDGKPEGMFYKDPVSGDMIYSMPFSRKIISWAAGIPESDAPALVSPLTGLNLAGSIFPGFGPVTDTLVNNLIPNSSRLTGLREFLFPFGEPATPDSAAARAEGFEAFLPAWLVKLASGFRSQAALGQLANAISQAESNVSYQNARNHVARLLMNSQLRDIKRQQQEEGVTGQDVNSPVLVRNQAKFFDQVTNVTDRIWMVRGIAQFIGPASPFLQWYADTNEGNVMVALMVDEMNKAMDAYVAEGMSPDLAIGDMLDKYGVEVFMSATPNTQSTLRGADSSDEWYGFYLDNRELVDSYPLIGAFFGPTGEFSNDARSSMISQGIYEVKSQKEQFEDAAFSLSYVAYNRERDRLGPETGWSTQEAEYLSAYRADLENQFGVDLETFANERRRQIGQLEQMLQDSWDGDEVASAAMNSDLGVKIQEYLAYRQWASEEADRRGTNWARGRSAADLREIMRQTGVRLSEGDPVFSRLFQFVFRGEMLRAEEDAPGPRPSIVPAR